MALFPIKDIVIFLLILIGFSKPLDGKRPRESTEHFQGNSSNYTASKNPSTTNSTLKCSETSTYEGKKSVEGEKTAWIYYGYIFSCIGSSLLTIIIYKIYKKFWVRKLHFLTRQEIEEFKRGHSVTDSYEMARHGHSDALFKPYDRLLEISKGKLEIFPDQIIWEHESEVTCKALLKDETYNPIDVALKMINPASMKGQTLRCQATTMKRLLSEIKILSYLGQHPNIVSIIGAYTAEITNAIVYVVTELCPLGPLKKALKELGESVKQNESDLPIYEMMRWSYEIACGMEYLEQKHVFHGDLSARNVLLSSDRVAKITDFGLSRRLYEYADYKMTTQEPLPWRWMAVESLKFSEFSTKSDVWSYGVTLWEIFSLGSLPYTWMTWDVEFVEHLEEGLRLEKPKYASQDVFDIMQKCWKFSKNARPSFADLKDSTLQIRRHHSVYESITELTECVVNAKDGE